MKRGGLLLHNICRNHPGEFVQELLFVVFDIEKDFLMNTGLYGFVDYEGGDRNVGDSDLRPVFEKQAFQCVSNDFPDLIAHVLEFRIFERYLGEGALESGIDLVHIVDLLEM